MNSGFIPSTVCPKSPKNSPYRRPNIIVYREQTFRILIASWNNLFSLATRVVRLAKRRSIRPYPASPRIKPKNRGKKRPMNGVGSNEV
jgi:hypothetical protein